MVIEVPGAMAAIVSDRVGDAIDFAHDPRTIGDLDVQLIGAQIGQAVEGLAWTSTKWGMRDPSVVVEATRHILIASLVSREYTLALFLGARSNLARALSTFRNNRARLATLLAI
jgi:hypothetical protein